MIEKEAIELLSNSGYLVFKIPECNKDFDHGRHELICRSAQCEGKGVIPHGVVGGHQGTFSYWIVCACGHSFSTHIRDDQSSPWIDHQREFNFSEED